MSIMDRGRAFRAAVLGARRVDPLAHLSDVFASGPLAMLDRGWIRRDDTTTPAGDGQITSLERSAGSYLMTIDAGGGNGSLHLANNRGVQWARSISALRFGVETLVTLRNGADSGNPPSTNYRLAGLVAHDDHSDATADHVVLAWGTANGGFPRAFWAHTVAGVTGGPNDLTPGFNLSTTLMGAARYLRMLRDRGDSDRWVLQHRASTSDPWTTVRDVQRGAVSTAMPDTVLVGLTVFSDQATHDVAGRFAYVRVFTPAPYDFP